ncbi:MAG: PHP domain-containing protein [Betaproteobacteria bacterium]
MNDLQNFDLHNHSILSDGLLTPRALMELAATTGCEAIALTDHDTTDGLAEAALAAKENNLRFIRGVEISVTWPLNAEGEVARADIKPITIHIVGLNIDPANAELAAGLDAIRHGRLVRGKLMGADFARIGIDNMFEDAYAIAENKSMLGRTHFARVLVARGLVQNVGRAFERYLTFGRPGYVAHQWASLTDAVGWINAAGGVAVLAHPGRYKLSKGDMKLLLEDFKAAGGLALEVVTGSHQPHQYREFAALAREMGFLASRGSDYHGPGESPFKPGKLPALPENLTPVWSAFAS